MFILKNPYFSMTYTKKAFKAMYILWCVTHLKLNVKKCFLIYYYFNNRILSYHKIFQLTSLEFYFYILSESRFNSVCFLTRSLVSIDHTNAWMHLSSLFDDGLRRNFLEATNVEQYYRKVVFAELPESYFLYFRALSGLWTDSLTGYRVYLWIFAIPGGNVWIR